MMQSSERAAHTGRTVDVEIVTRAPAVRVYEAWSNPERLVQWFADRATGAMETGQELRWTFERLGVDMAYRVLDASPPSRILLEALGPVPGRLEVTINGSRDGTWVRLIHSGFPQQAEFDEEFAAIASGWRLAMAVLRYYLEFHFGESRTAFFVCRPARFPLSRLVPLYHTPAGLQEWLTEAGSLGTPGGRVHLVLRDGGMLRGDMLADTGTEVAMAWDEISGVLELKCFPWHREPGMRALSLLGWGWGLAKPRALEIEQQMAAALERLEQVLEATSAAEAVSRSV